MADIQEIETKFLVRDIHTIELRLIELKADILKTRCLEKNFRFDTKENKLSSESKVLRLRQDSQQWMTYKEPGGFIDGIPTRKEIEFSISDLHAARSFLEALGFSVIQTYEKYRAVYILNNTRIMVDELPIGNFVEIEGDEVQLIKKVASDLNLRWELRVDHSYLTIFNTLCLTKGIEPRDLSFETNSVDINALSYQNIFPSD
jgi:adenylate cyclase, class 2